MIINKKSWQDDENKDWAEYYKFTKKQPPSELLIKALVFVKKNGKAIDIGGGALKDTRYLLQQGFDVTVIDGSKLMEKEAKKIKSNNLHYFISSFADFNFPKNKYDIASAMYSLPFNSPESFDIVLTRIKQSLVQDGIFCGQFFGVRHGWNTNKLMTFHTKKQVEKLFSDMKVLSLVEEEYDKIVSKVSNHWQVFHFIARKL